MVRHLILVICLALVACGSPTTPTASQEPNPTAVTAEPTTSPETGEPTQVAPEEEPVSWQDPYETVKAELCPQDPPPPEPPTPTEQPFFGGPTGETLDGISVFVQRGLYANSQNEIFRIDVTGVTESAVTDYTRDLKVCLDYVTSGTPPPEVQEQPPPSTIPAVVPFGSNPEDLLIQFYVQGLFGPEKQSDEVVGIIQEIVAEPIENWEERFRRIDLPNPPSDIDFMIDLVLDPTVNNGATHQYLQQRVTKIYVTSSVQYGAGSVTSGICRGDYITTPMSASVVTVTKGGTETDSRSDDPGTGYYYTYDLGVRGNTSGTYRIGGRIDWPGWWANYWDPAPTGSAKSCYP
jgi:hypothetical protein